MKSLEQAGYNYDEVQDVVNKLVKSVSDTKTIEQIVREVINGKWGNGDARKQRLTEAGYDYNKIQKLVNSKIQGSYKPSKKTNEQIAREVIAGKGGNGVIRKRKLQAAGYDYNTIQSIVNNILR